MQSGKLVDYGRATIWAQMFAGAIVNHGTEDAIRVADAGLEAFDNRFKLVEVATNVYAYSRVK